MKRAKTSARGESAAPSRVEEALEALYAAPFDGFVALRAELGRGLRSAGDPAGARIVAAAAKPTRTAWAMNQVTRKNPAAMNGIVDAWKTASNAPLRREGVHLVDAARRYREAVADVVREARAALEPDGVSLSPAQTRRMAETLQALVRDETTRAELLRGRLTRDVAVDDPFAGFDADTPEDVPQTEAAEPDSHKKGGTGEGQRERLERERAANQRAHHERAERERAEREREAKARAREALRVRIASAEAILREANHRVQDARAALARAQGETRRAEIAAEQYEVELASLRGEWEKLAP